MTIWRTPTRFAIVGFVCAVTHNAILLAGDLWHMHYALSCAISFVVVVVLGFMLHVRYTFQQPPTAASFWRYCASMAANYPITLALLFIMCDIAGWPVPIAAPAATILLVLWNFLASRWAIVGKATATPASVMIEKSAPSRRARFVSGLLDLNHTRISDLLVSFRSRNSFRVRRIVRRISRSGH